MGTRILSLCVITLALGIGSLLAACGQIGESIHADLVSFDALVANPQQYAGQSLCTTAVHVDGFEAGGLAASTYEKDGYTLLSEPVIWLEGVDLQSREDCTQTDTQPPFEFCRVIACGIFETGGGYGHGGAYAHQLRGRDASANVDRIQIEPKPVSPVMDRPTITPVSTPDRGGDMPTVQPPPALLEEQHNLFSYHRDGATELWTIDPASGAVQRQIRPDQTILDPAQSPSGETVAYVHMTGDYAGVVSELWLMDNEGANPRPLYVPPVDQSVLSRPAWQPDGQEIYYLQLGSGTASQLLRIAADGGEPVTVLTDCLDFALSPDGEWLASVSLDRGLALWKRDGTRLGELASQSHSFTDYDSLAVSPSGDLLAFRGTDGDTWNLYVMDLSSRDVRRLTDLSGFHALEPSGGQVNGLAWTAAGTHLVYSVDGDPEQTGIWRVGVEDGERQRLFAWAEGEWVTIQGPWLEPFPRRPVLTVDESPIVAAGIDGPGHFEYTDRLGEQIQARIEGLRAYAAGQELARANVLLAPFGYRLEARFDGEWDRTFYDLYNQASAEPMLAGLSHVWPVSVNASGTDFGFVAENAPNAFPLYLQVQSGSVEPWEADQSAYLPPAYVDDALARVTFTGFPTLTYQVELDSGHTATTVYSGTAIALGAYMPLRSFTTWDGHWVLEVDDHLIMDGQDVGQVLGYDAAFGFTLIHGQPFYFFEQDGQVRMSYGGRTLPNVYDQVFHNQCCEAAMHNVETLGDAVLFHALWDGTWYLVEAGVFDGERVGTFRYTAPEGWSFRYPMHWDRLDEELGFVQDTATGKTVTFATQLTTQAGLERWLESEIARKLAATEADNTLAEPLATTHEGNLAIYRYAIRSRLEASETLLRATILFDGQRRYEFYAAIPPLAEEEYAAIVSSFRLAGK